MIKLRNVALMVLLPLATLYASLFVGRFAVRPGEVAHILLGQFLPIPHDWPRSAESIVLQIRLPRAVLAMFVGGGSR